MRAPPIVIKKYGNRRLYDTAESRYVTLEEVAATIRRGFDVKILDARNNDDLTQPTLAQIILESRGAASLLPVPLLEQLIRLEDEALAEFVGRWVSQALDAYLQMHGMAEAVAPLVPMATAPFSAASAFARLLSGQGFPMPGFGFPPGFGFGPAPTAPPASAPAPAPAPAPPPAPAADDVAELRKELDELRRELRRGGRGRR